MNERKTNDVDLDGGRRGWRVAWFCGAKDFADWNAAYGFFRYIQTLYRDATITGVN